MPPSNNLKRAALAIEDHGVVGVAGLMVVDDPKHGLLVRGVGSGVAITAYDPDTKIGGLLYFMVPGPPALEEEDIRRVLMFATSAIPRLLAGVTAAGADRERLVLCAAGAAEIMDDDDVAIGHHNREAMLGILGQRGLALAAEDTGGMSSRTLRLEFATGRVTVEARGEERVLWSR